MSAILFLISSQSAKAELSIERTTTAAAYTLAQGGIEIFYQEDEVSEGANIADALSVSGFTYATARVEVYNQPTAGSQGGYIGASSVGWVSLATDGLRARFLTSATAIADIRSDELARFHVVYSVVDPVQNDLYPDLISQVMIGRSNTLMGSGSGIQVIDGYELHLLARLYNAVDSVVPYGTWGQNGLNKRVTVQWGKDYLPGATPDHPLLPSLGELDIDDRFVFDIPVVGDYGVAAPIFIDPEIAVGYDYTTDTINFASVIIPDVLPFGDSAFEILFGDYSFAITAGTTFSFTDVVAEGVAAFSLRGINVTESLDPDDPTAFVTGLTFVHEGATMVQMIPQTVSVPESSSLVLMASAACIVVGGNRWRSKRPMPSKC